MKDFSDLIWIVAVVGWVIIQLIAKAKRKGAPPSAPPPVADDFPTSPADELRKFLESMGQTQEAPAEERPAPPPPRPSIRVVPRDARRVETVAEPSPAQQTLPAALEAPALPALAAVAAGTLSPMMKRVERPPAPTYAALDLRHHNILRRAIIEREILGPPVALRRGAPGMDWLQGAR